MQRLLIINNRDSFTYNLVDLIRRIGVYFHVVDVDKLDLDQIENFSHILISPGPDVPESYPQLFSVLQRFYTSKAILGVCLGHQAICKFFGAGLFNLPDVRHGHAQRLKVRSNSRLFSGLPSEFTVGLYHSWAVSQKDFPIQLDITAICGDGIIMAIQHCRLPVYGIQFHPESYISEYGERILKNFLFSE